MKPEENKILDHNYDGIQECDNVLPRWWLNIFYVCIIFSFVYMYHYHFGAGVSQNEIFDAQLAAENALKSAATPLPGFETVPFAAIAKDPTRLSSGKALFQSKCVSCHAPGGAGAVGPNLTDEYWIHGGKDYQIAKTISEGVPDKGMIPWSAVLSREDIISVAAYVVSIKGTKPANPKAPQGVKETP